MTLIIPKENHGILLLRLLDLYIYAGSKIHRICPYLFKELLMFIPKFYSIILPLSTYLIE